MSGDKITTNHIIQVKRDEIHTLDKKIAKLREEINQIELAHFATVTKPSKYKRVLQVFKKIKCKDFTYAYIALTRQVLSYTHDK